MDTSFDPLRDPGVSYSYRARPERSIDVWRNRVGVTGSLFATAIGLSVLLGRRRP